MSLAPGTKLGSYEILALLGEGGMGEVYRARDTRLEREVAIKALPAVFSTDLDKLQRFTREARLLASLNHANIGAIYGVEEGISGEWFLILELVDGEPLSDRLKLGAVELSEALEICVGIAEALESAHDCGIIHCDLTPANVILTRRGGVKVLDFGLARRHRPVSAVCDPVSGPPQSRPGFLGGTPGYMSPEQVLGQEQDRRTDIFAFGCLLYECLAGHRAFGHKTGMDAMAAVLVDEPEWTELPTQTPPGIRDLLARCLSKRVGERPDNFGEILRVLEHVQGTKRIVEAPRSPVPNNIPTERTSFMGREKELAECARLLGETRLLTLTGIGGCGKTRLAIRLAQRVLEDFADGVWYVDLAALKDPDRAPSAIASVLGIREESGIPLIQTLANHFKGKRALLILDNCEQVLGACAGMTDCLLASAARLKLLVTSREGLGVEGEHLLVVRSLAVPSIEEQLDPTRARNSESVRLFEDRATIAEPDFRLSEDATSLVCDICRHLDGIPLAIELAAARVRVLSLGQIHSMLKDRFRLLTGGTKALPRQQTLRATIQWSYDQLATAEQRLFRLLSVFAGGWTLDGAIAVAGEGRDEFGVVDRLTRLVDKSLVLVQREAGLPRYAMLETVRQFALEHIDDEGDAAAARTRHLDYYLELAEDADPKLDGPEQHEYLRLLDRELENLLTAHEWCDHADDGVLKGLALVWSLGSYWEARGLFDLGLRTTLNACRRPGAESFALPQARALRISGWLAYYTGQYSKARELLEQSLSIARAKREDEYAASALLKLGIVHLAIGDLTAGQAYMEESLSLSRETGMTRRASAALNNLGDIYRVRGDLGAAGRFFSESLNMARQSGDSEMIAIGSLNLAAILVMSDETRQASEALLESLKIACETGHMRLGFGVLICLAGLAITSGDWQRGARYAGAAAELTHKTGLKTDRADELFIQPLIVQAQRTLGPQAYETAFAGGRAVPLEDALVEAREWLDADRQGV
ncbi:MAG: protein kinase [candidate division Zixibacteria bacterium]|nr:protein kinase [candidate division Zixibacteria bacterium]